MDEDVSPLQREHSLSVVLPGGLEKTTTVHGSKPVMDLLVTLCASHHLNPSDYTVEVLSPSNTSISFKPNSPIGLLEAQKIVLKPRSGEEKIKTPYVPEATVRLLINYNKSHKAVVRVNPRLPLEKLLPVVCDKCEFEYESTVLLRDSESKEPLDLSRTLNELGLREMFAKDTAVKEYTGHQHHTEAAIAPNKVSSSSSLQDLTKMEKKKSENKGLFSLFIKHKKKSELSQAVSAPTSPGLKSRSASVSTQDVTPGTTPTADLPKKRRAPPPPMGASNSTPNHLSTCHLQEIQRSGDDTLRSTKKRAPPPPPPVANHDQDFDTTKDCALPGGAG
ncbi:cordon-bleu protein-like 1 [Eucyclogobius newberryi]|uniref:cordon-bleu protein-like 1 n=1 Tax=Eucyclogobius newberryi TaxID=166745 RepID=UPI003B5AB82B